MSLLNLGKVITDSPFHVRPNDVGVDIESCLRTIARYCDRNLWTSLKGDDVFFTDKSIFKELKFIIEKSVPPFQRDNDKWSKEMQVSFVFNLIRGHRAPNISLYTLENERLSNCKLLDGLQRITSLLEFYSGDMIFDLPEYDLNFKSEELLKEIDSQWRIFNSTPFHISIYNFKTELEAVEFYIAFNKNITHSKEDIQRAIDYKNSLLS